MDCMGDGMDYESLWNQLRRQSHDGGDLPFCRAWLADLMESMERDEKKESG